VKVLVADDDPGALLLARAAVERAGHHCIVASDGDEAWHIYRTQHPDVLVSDWTMPGRDGLALCRAIRAEESELYTYIVLVTSHGLRENILSGLEAGADDYVTKPLDPFVLHARLLVASRVTALHADLARYRKVLSHEARTDALTGLHNRLKLSEDLEQLHAHNERYGRDYCLVMCDVDNFKSYNDIYGHPAGDLALRSVASVLLSQARRSDGVYRFGGEEFLLVLPDQSQETARVLIERALAAVEALGITHAGSVTGVLTLSAGISGYSTGRPVPSDLLLMAADEALYRAKAAGRNRIALAP
jgi:diguanylate cyclase (GGDEF)-like protein